MICLILKTLLMFHIMDARMTKEEDLIVIDDTREGELTKITSITDEDIGVPAPDIWAWGLISDRYLPHVR